MKYDRSNTFRFFFTTTAKPAHFSIVIEFYTEKMCNVKQTNLKKKVMSKKTKLGLFECYFCLVEQ